MKELIPLLEKLALKLGVTNEMLWSSLIRQALINATTDLVLSIGLFSSLILAFRFVIKKTKPYEDKDYGDWCGDKKK